MELVIGETMRRAREFAGFGAQCDAYLYDEVNAAAGVRDEDYAVVERRIRALRLSVTRMFCHIDWFNPARDASDYRWELPGYQRLLRLLRLMQACDTHVNMVLFQPFGGQSRATYSCLVQAMGELLVRLRDVEGIDVVRWLTVYNEPETVFPHDSPLMRRLFGDACVDGKTDWEMLVDIWRETQDLLTARGLYPHIKLAVPDCVWGSRVRYERMALAAAVFADRDVTFSVHAYSPEDTSTQPADPAHQRDWHYPGMAREASDFRAKVGPERQMLLWEYNLEGIGGHTSFFPGVNRFGVHVLETIDAGPEILEKTILAVQGGYDGTCLWCLSDMLYCEGAGGVMTLGMWRFKHARWYPRPHYYYFSPLCQHFRRGMRLLDIAGAEHPVLALAARGKAETVVVLLNRGEAAESVSVAGLPSGEIARLRVHPGVIPYRDGDLPLDNWTPLERFHEDRATLELLPREASYLRITHA